ncbi:DCP1 domain containing protein [Asbolus verrucosus]|uniref:DCP1 domain containing protein n=1 Tax=Asbolus verrucosus TaxID=1661398 RepID=A0A482VNI9_ASBVE|nr:DCP1 domain containing protein [Asbolus verrucosus]
MNRLNTNNVIEPIVKDFDYQMQIPFLLYRNSKSKIFGIWFFNREECVHITYLIETVMESLKDKSNEKTKKQENGVDIFSLLSKAQEDFNKTPTKQDSVPPAFSTPRDCTSKSVMDFFAKASTKSTQKPIPMMSGGDGENVLQRLMSNPAHTVEHIEKQQRSITPQEQVGCTDFEPNSTP